MRVDEYTNMYVLEDRFWWYQGIHELIVSFLRREARGKPLRFLDAGCGTGKLMTLLAPLGEVSGIDASEEGLRYCRERGLTRIEKVDLNRWQAAGTYDVITCIDVLCHESIEDVGAVLDQFHRALGPGGLLVLNLPAFESLRRQHDDVVQTVRRLRKEDIHPLLIERGFEIEIATYRLPALYLMIRAKKALFPDSRREEPQSDLKSIPSPLNALLSAMHKVENHVVLAGLRFPVGSSLFVMGRKSGEISRVRDVKGLDERS
jgi:SAM-dependent methyltransferase